MLKTIIIIVAVLVVAILIFAATRPDVFRVQRAMSIKVPPEKIFAIINDHHNWGAWSPWEKLDPAMKKTYSGAASGTGAIYEWQGNSKAGAGRSEITESSPPSRMTMKLDMFRPFEGHNIVEFTLEPQGGATNVTWAMQGQQPYMAKVMSLFINCDNMVGKDFEEGLANLKTIAEK